jgi:uncharacterized protein
MAPSSAPFPRVAAATARRLLLDSQGLLADPRGPVTADRLYALVERMGFVQVDSINVVERAHHLTLASRLHGYRPALLTRLLERDRRLFEHWTHDAAALPAAWFPWWRSRFEHYRERARARLLAHPWWLQRLGADPGATLAHVRDRIAREGPLMARDFEDTRGPEAERTWWGWKPQKTALEYLWRTGELAIARRVNFHKVYDLTERVLPHVAALPRPADEEYLDWACAAALARLGVASAEEIAAFWGAIAPAEARAWAARAGRRGEAVEVEVEAADGSRPRRAWAVPDWRERAAAAPEAPARLRLLSPFDPILRDRRRTQRLFDFDYRFEAFVPEAQRRHGYYVLPLLEGERLVGRLDPKFRRDDGVLAVRQLWWEPGVRPGKARRAGLERALDRLARLIGAERWTLPAG